MRGERPTEQQNLQIRRALWAACRALDAEGRSVHAISRALNIDWHTARRLLDMPAPPDKAGGRRRVGVVVVAAGNRARPDL